MGPWILLKFRAPPNCLFDHHGWNTPFLDDSARQYGCDGSMKEVEDTIVHTLQADSKLMDAAVKQIRFRSTQFVTEFRETMNPDDTLVPGFGA
jgi:hypothetical protein